MTYPLATIFLSDYIRERSLLINKKENEMMKIKHVFMFVFVLLMGITLFADVDVGKVSVDTAPSFIYDADSIQDLALESIAVMAVETSTAEMVLYSNIDDNPTVQLSMYEAFLDTITDAIDVEVPGFMPRRSSISDSPDYMNIYITYEPAIPKFCSLYHGSAIHRTMRYRG